MSHGASGVDTRPATFDATAAFAPEEKVVAVTASTTLTVLIAAASAKGVCVEIAIDNDIPPETSETLLFTATVAIGFTSGGAIFSDSVPSPAPSPAPAGAAPAAPPAAGNGDGDGAGAAAAISSAIVGAAVGSCSIVLL